MKPKKKSFPALKKLFTGFPGSGFDKHIQGNDVLENILNNFPYAIYWKDSRGIYLGCNELFSKMTGSGNPENLSGRTDAALSWKKEDAEIFRSEEIEIMSGGKSRIHVEKQVSLADGSPMWIDLSRIPLVDGKGNVLGIMGIAEDISARKHDEDALKDSEGIYRALFENMLEGYALCKMILDDAGKPTDWTYLMINPAFLQLTGMKDPTGMKVTDVIPNIREMNPELFDRYGNVALTGKPDKFEVNFIPLQKWLRISVFSPAKEYFVAVFEDISETKRTEKALTMKDDLLLLTGEIAKVGGWEFDVATMKGTWTDEVARIHDLDPNKETTVELSVSFYYGDSKEKITKALDEAIDLGKPYDLQLEMISAKGVNKWVRTRGFPVFENDKVVKVRGIFQDITDMKKTQEEILKLNSELENQVNYRTIQLEDTLKELETFSYSVSHDLRAPLRGIDGWSMALVEDYKDKLDENGMKYLSRVREETQKMGQLIDDLLHLSRVSRSEMSNGKVDLSRIAMSIAEKLRQSDPGRNVVFSIQHGIIVKGDAALLEAALSNLLQNAWKFTSTQEEAHIDFSTIDNEKNTVYYIKDDGVGFDMIYSSKLFGAFQRLHKTSEFPGTGIGLATVKRIIHRHGGHIWAQSEVGKGATFYFTLKDSYDT